MQDIEPPESLPELIPEVTAQAPKKGFFGRLFSKKSSSEEAPKINLPELDLSSLELNGNSIPSDPNVSMNVDLNDLSSNSPNRSDDDSDVLPDGFPALPPISEQLEARGTKSNIMMGDVSSKSGNKSSSKSNDKSGNKSIGKHKKGQKRKIGKFDESSQFDWNREIEEQEILIHDSNRTNQDINVLINEADQRIEDKTPATTNSVFMSQHKDVKPEIEPLENEEDFKIAMSRDEVESQMPVIDMQKYNTLAKVSNTHQKLRKTLQRYLKNPTLFANRARFGELFQAYDESIEKNIKIKEVDLAKKKQILDKQEKDILKMYDYIKGLDVKLQSREKSINSTISESVETQLYRRLKEEKSLLKEELTKTVTLNNDLKKKVKIVEDDRIRFEREHQKLNESERKKLTQLQSIYDKKLKELDSERTVFRDEKKAFEIKRKVVLDLISRADTVSKELKDMEALKQYVDKNKKYVEKEIDEDKELKNALAAAEMTLSKEKQNLDGMMFNKYIEDRLKRIKPEYLSSKQDWKVELQSHPLYERIAKCKQLLLQRNISGAKAVYNDVRKAYEQIDASRKEKEALYTAIRELYNEIQMKIVESQMHSD